LPRLINEYSIKIMKILKQEKRRQKKFAKCCFIEFESGCQTYRRIYGHLSLNGLFLKIRKPVASDTIVETVVHLTDGSTSELRGRVTRPLRAPHNGVLERAGLP